MHRHYLMFGLNMLISTVIMYVVMFEMIRGSGEFVQNINFFYMALTMAMPMGALMLLMMGSMYADKRLNLILYAALALIFILAFAAVRTQALVGDKQFVRSMIPHHSGAILMCNQASLRDPEIRQLCFAPTGIVASQEREIAQMKTLLKRL
ncbi:DUF305 domain-containing protein [Sphingomonas sabuli]|uniref:DUF305 domain-containing protein n=2 Tax=Sphingomonas sabuli TaxID=2764186 RepID=A0A7G9L5S0_9SPHN|nr:DUF305 domain-containing protein [Sphingomonas sabuli]QNM83969.1 DUF305 domain-containing protein [Sphingomonas sabuli]